MAHGSHWLLAVSPCVAQELPSALELLRSLVGTLNQHESYFPLL